MIALPSEQPTKTRGIHSVKTHLTERARRATLKAAAGLSAAALLVAFFPGTGDAATSGALRSAAGERHAR